MDENYDKFMTIADAARKKSCTRQTIYNAIKTDVLKTTQIGGRTFILNDEYFQSMPIKKSLEPSLKRSVALLENRIDEAFVCIKRIEESLQDCLLRLKKVEDMGKKVPETKVRYKGNR